MSSAPPATLRQERAEVTPYRTKDGSTIRELMHPAIHGNARQSLAEAIVPAGTRTLLHRHATSEELYHVLSGHGLMTVDAETFAVAPQDTILIPPGAAHCIAADAAADLVILCCCSPAYRHEDTELLEAAAGA